MCSKHMALKVKELQAQIRTARDDVYVEAPGQGHPWLTGASVDEMACLLKEGGQAAAHTRQPASSQRCVPPARHLVLVLVLTEPRSDGD